MSRWIAVADFLVPHLHRDIALAATKNEIKVRVNYAYAVLGTVPCRGKLALQIFSELTHGSGVVSTHVHVISSVLQCGANTPLY